jgi:hypothetical protein
MAIFIQVTTLLVALLQGYLIGDRLLNRIDWPWWKVGLPVIIWCGIIVLLIILSVAVNFIQDSKK